MAPSLAVDHLASSFSWAWAVLGVASPSVTLAGVTERHKEDDLMRVDVTGCFLFAAWVAMHLPLCMVVGGGPSFLAGLWPLLALCRCLLATKPPAFR